ncbi:hypothetical protein [Bordetella genomosp. 9]|uniref:hypothetical protein n=1 Tax=Bordetella genomosp. 9 TaxID=1416803 RepID=UPI0018E01E15|nr:hypothetical protein [Bordetella genomosp. 9]
MRAGRLGLATLWSGSVASLASAAVLAWCGRRERGAPAQPVNAPSHWLWREEALRQRGFTLRHTVSGYLIHHGSSMLWAACYERLMFDRAHRAPRAAALALTVAGVAAAVDLKLTPQRFTPGFEKHLSAGALAAMYGVFGLALFGAHAVRRRLTDPARPPAPNPPAPARRHR